MSTDAVPPMVRAGFTLMGRYRLLAEYSTDLPRTSSWVARDQLRGRSVVVHILTGPQAQPAIDAARRAALVADPRIVPVIGAGSYGEVDYIVTAATDGVALSDHVPMAPSQARAVVGELAGALEAARSRGVHHLALRPSAIRLPSNGSVAVLGLGADAELFGIGDRDPQRASRTDAVGLVAVLYYCLTGLWPGRPGPGVRNAGFADGQPIPPADLVPGVPGDLDTLCAVTFGPHDDGPHSPADLVTELAPWGEVLLRSAGAAGIGAHGDQGDQGAGFGPTAPDEEPPPLPPDFSDTRDSAAPAPAPDPFDTRDSAVANTEPDFYDTRDSLAARADGAPEPPPARPDATPPDRPAMPPGVNQPARFMSGPPATTEPTPARVPEAWSQPATGSHSAHLPPAKPPLTPIVIPAPPIDGPLPPSALPGVGVPGVGVPGVGVPGVGVPGSRAPGPAGSGPKAAPPAATPPAAVSPPAPDALMAPSPRAAKAPSAADSPGTGMGTESPSAARPTRRRVTRSQAAARGLAGESAAAAASESGADQPAGPATVGKRVSPRGSARPKRSSGPMPDRMSAFAPTDRQLRENTNTYQAGFEAIMTSELPIVPPAPFAPMSPVADSPTFASLLADEEQRPHAPRDKRMAAIVTLLTIVAVVLALGIGLHYRSTIADLFAPPSASSAPAATSSLHRPAAAGGPAAGHTSTTSIGSVGIADRAATVGDNDANSLAL